MVNQVMNLARALKTNLNELKSIKSCYHRTENNYVIPLNEYHKAQIK